MTSEWRHRGKGKGKGRKETKETKEPEIGQLLMYGTLSNIPHSTRAELLLNK